MDLKNFSKQSETSNETASKDDVMKAINHYSKFSNEQLMTELAKQLAVQRGKGNSDNIAQTIDRIKPFLNADQNRRMEEVLKDAGHR